MSRIHFNGKSNPLSELSNSQVDYKSEIGEGITLYILYLLTYLNT